MPKTTDNAITGFAGEFYVLAQLAHRGLVGTMTLGHTKGVDILISNPELSSLFKMEVKTTYGRLGREKLFGDCLFFKWVMSAKHERITDKSLYYCFVNLGAADERRRYFIVPSSYVARYVTEERQHWLKSRNKTASPTSMRKFRIPEDDPEGFEDNWDVFTHTSG